MLDDATLVKRCLAGDDRAFEDFVDRYEKIVYNVALRMGNSCEDAQDVTQSVFIKVFENLSSYKSKYKFFSWLYRIAINESLNSINQRKISDELDENTVSNDKTPDEALQQLELDEIVQSSLMELKLEYRVAIVLNHFHDLSYSEISFILDVPEKTVKSRLFMGRQQLKKIMLKKRGVE